MESYQQERWDRLGPEADEPTNLVTPEEVLERWRRELEEEAAGVRLPNNFQADSQSELGLYRNVAAEGTDEEAA